MNASVGIAGSHHFWLGALEEAPPVPEEAVIVGAGCVVCDAVVAGAGTPTYTVTFAVPVPWSPVHEIPNCVVALSGPVV